MMVSKIERVLFVIENESQSCAIEQAELQFKLNVMQYSPYPLTIDSVIVNQVAQGVFEIEYHYFYG